MQHKLLAALLLLFFTSVARGQTPVIDSLQKIIAQDKRDSTELTTYVRLVDQYARTNIAAAKRYSLIVISLSRQLNHPLQLSAGYSELVSLYMQSNQTDSAKYYLALLKKEADNSEHLDIKSNYNFEAGLFYRIQGNYKASLPYMIEALRLFTLQNSRISMAGQNLNIGNNYLDLGDYRKAMAYHLQALNLFEALGNKKGMSFCYSSIGGDFIKLNQFAEALPYIKKSVAIKNELNDKRGIAGSYVSMGMIADGLKQPDKALASYKMALSINQALKLKVEEAKTDLSIGELYQEKNETDSAKSYFNASRDLFKQSDDTAHLARVNADMANLQNNISHQKMREKTIIGSLNTSIEMGDKNTELNNYKYLADYYEQNKQYDKALFYTKKYHDRSDTLQNKQLQLQVKELEQRYNLVKQEKEISLLKKDQLLDHVNLQNQKIFKYGAMLVLLMLLIIGFLAMTRFRVVQRSERLLEMEKMRNTIARNLHDDIGSTLSSINILSKVALKKIEAKDNASRDLEIIKNSSFSIMENMSDIVWAINPVNDPFEKTIMKMKSFASAILEPAGIGFKFNEDGKLAGLTLGVDERKNFYLIYKEAINNIAKYSGATMTEIALQKTTHQFLMKITDNGKGFDKATQPTGDGLKNMESRAAEMNAGFEINSRPAAGTSILVSVSIT